MYSVDKKTKIICISFLVAISLAYWIISPIGVDMQFHILRIGELGKELARGTAFPVYMYRDVYSHYGYPLPIFYCSLFLYPFAALVTLGIQAITAYKLMIIVCMWVIFAVAYVCIGRFDGYEDYRFAGAFLYTLQPFLLNELFVRASIGAACVFIFIPVVLLGLYYIMNSASIKGALLLGGGMTGIVSSHVVSTVLIVIALAVVYVCIMAAHIRTLRVMCNDAGKSTLAAFVSRTVISLLVSVIICLALTAWYIFPMLEQFMSYEFQGQMVSSLRIEGENPLTIMIPMHLLTTMSSIVHRYLGLSEIGGASVSMLVYTIYLIVTGRIRKLTETGYLLLIVYYVMYVLLFVGPLWEMLGGLLGFMQFTWRVYLIISIVGFIFCMVTLKPDSEAVNGADFVAGRAQIVIAIIVAVYVLVFFFGYYAVRNLMPSLIESRTGHEISAYEYSSETEDALYIPTCMDESILADRPRQVDIDGYDVDEDSGIVTISIEKSSEDDTIIEFPFIMYNGYSAENTDSGERYEVFASPDGLVDVHIPAGVTGHILVSYTGTLTQRITFIISMISFVAFVGACIFAYKKSI